MRLAVRWPAAGQSLSSRCLISSGIEEPDLLPSSASPTISLDFGMSSTSAPQATSSPQHKVERLHPADQPTLAMPRGGKPLGQGFVAPAERRAMAQFMDASHIHRILCGE